MAADRWDYSCRVADEPPTAPAARLQTSASYSFTMRMQIPQYSGAFARVAQAIAETDAMLGAIDLVRVESKRMIRDVTVACVDSAHAETVVAPCARSTASPSRASPTARS